MQTFSKHIASQEPTTQRRLYTLFQREVKAGRIPALKLLTKFQIQNTQGQPRQVQDYAFTDETVGQVAQWIEGQAKPEVKGFTVEQVQTLSDADLMALIQQQRKPAKKRKPRADKGSKKTTNTESWPEPVINEDEEAAESVF